MKLRTALSYILMFSLLALLTACGSSGDGTVSASKVSVKIHKASASIHRLEVFGYPIDGGKFGDKQVLPEDLENNIRSATLDLDYDKKYLIRVLAYDDNSVVVYSGQKVFTPSTSNNEVTIDCYSMDGFDKVSELYEDLIAETQDGTIPGLSFFTHEGIISGTNTVHQYIFEIYLAANKDSVNTFDVFFIATDSSSTNVESTATGTMNANTGAASGTGIDHTDHDKSFNWWFKPFVNQPHP